MGRSAPTDKSHMPEVVRLLAAWGATAEPVHLGDELIELARIRVDYDLYVLKDKSDLAMRVAAALHAAEAALLNPYPASATLRDRIVKLRVLQAAGVPTPKTFVASHVDQLRAALEHGSLVIKPHRKLARSAPGEGIHIVRDAAELAALPPISEPVFAQRYLACDGPDRKIYSIGSEIFGVLRSWPARTHREKLGQAFTPDPELVDITRRCGAALGADAGRRARRGARAAAAGGGGLAPPPGAAGGGGGGLPPSLVAPSPDPHSSLAAPSGTPRPV